MTYFNEFLFFLHLFFVSTFVILALRIGKNALISLMGIYVIMMNLFITKQISLFGLSLTTTDSFTVGIGLILNLLQEYWGKEEAVKTVRLSFFLAIIFLVMAGFQLFYIPHLADGGMHQHFVSILNFTPRIIIASLISFFITQFVDTTLYSFFKKIAGEKYFILRNYGSLFISQAIDTVLFSFLGLYGIVNNIFDIIVASYIIKIIVILLATPYISVARKLIKKNLHQHE
jgi:uncharacterized integral membrane protein (TIGR00697 family)